MSFDRNEEIFQYMVEEANATPAEASVVTGRMDLLNPLAPAQLLAFENQQQIKRRPSLLQIAFLYGRLEAIQLLLDKGLKIPDQEAFYQCVLAMFVGSSDHTEVDQRTPESLTAIYHFLKQRFPQWCDEPLFNRIFLAGAKEMTERKRAMGLHTLLQLNLLSDVNVMDETDKSVLYYLIKNGYTELTDQLKQRGATLTAVDESTLQLNAAVPAFLEALTQDDQSAVQSHLQALIQHQTLLTQDEFRRCLELAIQQNQLATVSALLDLLPAKRFIKNIFAEYKEVIKNIQSVALATLLVNYAIENDKNEKIENNLFEATREIGHRIGVSGELSPHEKLTRQFTMESSDDLNEGFQTLQEMTALHSRRAANFSPLHDDFKWMSCVIALNNPSMIAALCLQRYQSGNMVLFKSGWFGHVVGFAVKYDRDTNKTYLSISNRGQGRLEVCMTEAAKQMFPAEASKTGTIIYELDGMLPDDFFAQMQKLKGADHLPSPAAFQEKINHYLKQAKPVAMLPAQPQGHLTCNYVNLKRAIEGALFILALLKGKPPDPKTIADVYQQYKAFSIEDKGEAYDYLTRLYQDIAKVKSAADPDMSVLNRLVVAVLLSHHSLKQDERELDLAKKLYVLLPRDLQQQVAVVLPMVAEPIAGKYNPEIALFTREKRLHGAIKITGEMADVFASATQKDNLIHLLRQLNITADQIPRIHIEKQTIKIFTAPDKALKEQLREMIQSQLGADIANVEGRFEFIIKNPAQLSLKMTPRKS